jgi:hypothetical protein
MTETPTEKTPNIVFFYWDNFGWRRGRAVHRFGAGKRQFPCYCEYLAPAPAQASSPGDLRRGMGM